jgi:hypothetical protein
MTREIRFTTANIAPPEGEQEDCVLGPDDPARQFLPGYTIGPGPAPIYRSKKEPPKKAWFDDWLSDPNASGERPD